MALRASGNLFLGLLLAGILAGAFSGWYFGESMQVVAWMGTFFLNALAVPSTLSGTVISTGNFTFDVNPDCSGSTSLRIMLTLGALWFGMYPNLTLGRRLQLRRGLVVPTSPSESSPHRMAMKSREVRGVAQSLDGRRRVTSPSETVVRAPQAAVGDPQTGEGHRVPGIG